MNNISHFNMVEQQIRPWNVSSMPLLEAIKLLDRSKFVPDEQQALCFVDTAIKLQENTKMLEPKVSARMVQALNILEGDRVLVIGAGSGYSAALCAKLAKSVDCVDSDQSLLDSAKRNCEAAGIQNIKFDLVENIDNFSFFAEYDAILVRQARFSEPDCCFTHLTPAGRCVALIGDDCVMQMMRYTQQDAKIKMESVADILLPLNQSDARKKAFVF